MVTEDGAYFIASVVDFMGLIDIDEYRLHTQNQLLILNDMKLSKYQLIRLLSLVSDLHNYVNYLINLEIIILGLQYQARSKLEISIIKSRIIYQIHAGFMDCKDISS